MEATCVSPSSILFTDCTASTSQAADEITLEEISRNVSENRVYPKLQVVKKDGKYFTLNNTQLHVYRRLEETGVCGRVQVVIVAPSDVPEGIRNLMVVPQPRVDNIPSDDLSRKTGKGYEEVAQGDTDDGNSSDSSESSQAEDHGPSSEDDDEWSCDDKADTKDRDSRSSGQEDDSFL